MGELKGIYIDSRNGQPGDENASSSGISSVAGSMTGNNNYTDLPRKRNISPDVGDIQCGSGSQLDDYEMEKIRYLMAHMDGEGRMSGSSLPISHRGSIEPNLMSTVFGVVLVIVISISLYAFASLFRAVIKRMNP